MGGMDPKQLERIADALERIAASLESKPLTELPPVKAEKGIPLNDLMYDGDCDHRLCTIDPLCTNSPGAAQKLFRGFRPLQSILR